MEDFIWADPTCDEARTICKLCLNYCGIIVSNTNDGIKIKGDDRNPQSRGFLCPKGRAALDIAGNPDRILYPLKRLGDRGSQRWERISWREAIGEISSKLQTIMSEYGAESVCLQSLPPKDFIIWLAFAKAIGAPNYFRHDHHVCFTPQFIADILTFGNLVTYPNFTEEDAEKTKTIVHWGVNTPETNPAIASALDKARKKSLTKIVVIDPRPIGLTEKADIWIRPRPGTDMALALGMMNVIIKEKLYDTKFVKEWTHGFDKLMKHIEEYTPAKVAEITWVKEKTITETARLIATNKPTAIFTFMGLIMGGNSINTVRSLGLLLAITGNIDIAGSNFIKVPPKTERIILPEELLSKQLGADQFPLLSGSDAIPARFLPSAHPFHVVNAMRTGKPYPVKALFTDANVLTALEDSKRTLEAFRNLELLVTFELFMTPTAEFSDYILPVVWFLESNSVVGVSSSNFIGARKMIFQPRGEAKEEGEVLIDIMRELGVLDKLPFSNYKEYLDWRLKPLGLTFEDFAQRGYVVNPNIDGKYEKGLLRTDGKPGFNTPSGKIELYSTILEKYGYDPLPVYKELVPSPYSTPDIFKDYPFILITGTRSLPIYHGLGLQIPNLRKLHPKPIVEISPSAAEKLSIREGDRVAIEVPGKKEKVYRNVHIVKAMHDNVVCAEGHWYLPEENQQQKRVWDANINVLTSLRDDYDPIVGGSGCRRLLCRINKARNSE